MLKRCAPSLVIDRERVPERHRQPLISEVRVHRGDACFSQWSDRGNRCLAAKIAPR